MEIEVAYSWTVDLVIWDCPKCGHTNEITDFANDNGCCQECGFQIPNYSSHVGECDGDTDIYEFENEDE